MITPFELEVYPGVGGNFSDGSTGETPENTVLEYRHGNSPIFYPIKMPGLGKVGNVTMRGCQFPNTSPFQEWVEMVQTGGVEPVVVKVVFVGEDGPEASWHFEGAVAVKVTEPQILGETAEIAELGIEFESVTVKSLP